MPAAAPFVRSIPRQVNQLSGVNLTHNLQTNNWSSGWCFGGGALYAVSNVAGQSSTLVQWSDPYDLSFYNNITLPGGSLTNIGLPMELHSACYDPVNNSIYVGVNCGVLDGGNGNDCATIYGYNIGTGKTSTVVFEQDLGFFAGQFTIQSAICTDGTYIYMVLFSETGGFDTVAKFQISNGLVVATRQPPNATGAPQSGVTNNGSNIALLNSTTLAVAGEAYAWIAILPTSLASTTVCKWVGTAYENFFRGGANAVVGSNFYLVDAAIPRVYKTDGTISSVTFYPTAGAIGNNSMSYDGTYLWVIDKDWTVTVMDPSNGNIVAVHRELCQSHYDNTDPANIQAVPGAYLVTGSDGVNSQSYIVPTGDSSYKPAVIRSVSHRR